MDGGAVRSEVPRSFRASAPTRLDFAGGWTDVPPFSEREGGAVVNAAIGLRVHAEVQLGGESMVLRADDLHEVLRVSHPMDLSQGERLPLHRAALRMFPVGPCTLRTRSDVPPGAGLGGSGALDVALVAVLTLARGERVDPDEAALNGWHLEVIEAGLPGGRQDQYAAALGGFHLFEFRDPAVTATPLALDPGFLAELERRTLLCYTGRSRLSGETIVRVMAAYERGEPAVTGALQRLRALAYEMADALVAADLARVGALLAENWRCQQALDPAMCTPEMRRLEAALRAAGALGGKAAGAGAGGCMFFLAGDDVGRAQAAAGMSGAELLPLHWSPEGVAAC
jgi:D-glycero-alpha-D-manno-heptose-7-phosphate kinase